MSNAVGAAKGRAHAAPWTDLGQQHIRNICFSLGGEQGPNNGTDNLSDDSLIAEIKYFFADMRLCKNNK
jgi:hypothetical protein